MRNAFAAGQPMAAIGTPKAGMHGGDVNRFARRWHEVSLDRIIFDANNVQDVWSSAKKWVPLNKGGQFRRWFGNHEYILAFDKENYQTLLTVGNKLPSKEYYFLPSVSWSKVTSSSPSFRMYPTGYIFDVSGTPVFGSASDLLDICACANSNAATVLLAALAPTLNFEIGQVASLPIVRMTANGIETVEALIQQSTNDWNSNETSWDFRCSPLISSSIRPERGID